MSEICSHCQENEATEESATGMPICIECLEQDLYGEEDED